MKKQLILIATTATVFFLNACGDSSTTADDTDTSEMAMIDTAKRTTVPKADMKTPVITMQEKVKVLPMTENLDRDFANVILLSHQEAVDISKMAVASAKDPEVKEIAQRMVADHESEIERLKSFVAGPDTTSVYPKPANTSASGDHHSFSNDLNIMMDTLKNKTLTGNVDRDYVTLMLAHHQNAVSLEQDEVMHGQQTKLKDMAKAMMADDKKEIAQLELWLRKMKK